MMITVWIVSGVISFLNCLPFAELSTLVPKSGSIYIYIQTAFSSMHPFFGGLPGFLYFWINYTITQPCNTALTAMLFSDYFFVLLKLFVDESHLSDEAAVKLILGAVCLVSIGILNCVSVKLYVRSQDLLTFTKLAAIVFTVGCGVYMYISGQANQYDPGFEGTIWSVQHLTQAMYFGLYAYDGGWAITGITEEIKNPSRNILYSIVIALAITTATYLFLNLAFLTALTPDEIANGTTTIADFTKKLFGAKGGAMAAAIICLSLLTSLMCSTFHASRLGFVAAREGHIIEALCYIHKTLQTPAPAVVAQMLLSLIYFFVGGNITLLIDMCSFFAWMSYGVTMAALFVLRKKFPDAICPFRVPTLVPVLVAIISCYLVIVSLSIIHIVLLVAFVVCATFFTVVYYIFIYKGFKVKHLDKLQKKLQQTCKLILPRMEASS